jgi:hypothetical protein
LIEAEEFHPLPASRRQGHALFSSIDDWVWSGVFSAKIAAENMNKKD